MEMMHAVGLLTGIREIFDINVGAFALLAEEGDRLATAYAIHESSHRGNNGRAAD